MKNMSCPFSLFYYINMSLIPCFIKLAVKENEYLITLFPSPVSTSVVNNY